MALVKVRYKGFSDVRIMSKSDLASVGVNVDGQLRWDRSNHWAVHVQDMSPELEQVLRDEGTFSIEEVDAQTGKTVKNIVTATKADDTGDTVVDGNTGQRSTKPSR